MTQLQNLNEQGVALQGYDPVSYFSGQPAQGNDTITTEYDGAVYHFINDANKAIFDAEPNRYRPQYGGFCAVAVSEGKTFPIEPNTYLVSDDKLFLFYNGKLGNTKPDWESDPQTRQSNADSHWLNNDLAIIYPTMNY